MSDSCVLVKRSGDHVAIVTLNRPAVANVVDPVVALELERVVRDIEADPEIWVAVITGAGEKAFCAGADLKTVAAGDRASLYTSWGGFAGFVTAPRNKVWIAAVEGVALAGGLEIALSCDLIVAGPKAKFGLPEVKRGMIAAAGGLYLLARRIPRGAALLMIATGDSVDGTRAAELGLVDRLVTTGPVLDGALGLAAEIAANAPVAVQESLGVARAAFDFDPATLAAMSQQAALRNVATEDFSEGPRAFLEKRPPNWQGR